MTSVNSEQRRQPSEEVRQDVATIEDACKRAAARIKEQADKEQALEDAAYLAKSLREVANSAAEVRTRAIQPVWDEGKMPLSQLAQRIGVSKARADQITRTFKTDPSQEGQ